MLGAMAERSFSIIHSCAAIVPAIKRQGQIHVMIVLRLAIAKRAHKMTYSFYYLLKGPAMRADGDHTFVFHLLFCFFFTDIGIFSIQRLYCGLAAAVSFVLLRVPLPFTRIHIYLDLR